MLALHQSEFNLAYSVLLASFIASSGNAFAGGAPVPCDFPTNEIDVFFAPDIDERDFLGGAVAVSGNLAVAGGTGFDSPGGVSGMGEAYVFSTQTGALVSTLFNPAPGTNDQFGNSVSISGDLAIVGARYDDPGGVANSGTAYVYNANTGSLYAAINNPTSAAGDAFGYSVSISGNRAVIGAPGDDPGGVGNAGTAYVRNAFFGTAISTLNNPAPGLSDEFGFSVAISADLVVVGAPGDASGAGTAYVFAANTGVLLTTISNPAAAAGDRFGCSVAISGNLVVVGAQDDNPGGVADAGSAYVFDAIAGTLISTLDNPTPAASDNFGNSVGIAGYLVIVGAVNADIGADLGAGQAHLFHALTGGNFGVLDQDPPRYDGGFGSAVAISSTRAVVGVSKDNFLGLQYSGAVYTYAQPTACASPTSTPSPTPVPTACGVDLASYANLNTAVIGVRADADLNYTAGGKFTLAAPSNICEISVFGFDVRPINRIENLSCRLMIHQSSGTVPGAVVADLGVHSPVHIFDTGINETVTTAGNDIYFIHFRPPVFALPAGSYWLSIYDQTTNNTELRLMRASDAGGGAAQAPGNPPGVWSGLTQSLALAVSGMQAPTPTPTRTPTATPTASTPPTPTPSPCMPMTGCVFPTTLSENSTGAPDSTFTGPPDDTYYGLGNGVVTYALPLCGTVFDRPGPDFNVYEVDNGAVEFALVDVLVSTDGLSYTSVSSSAGAVVRIPGDSAHGSNAFARSYDLQPFAISGVRFIRLQGLSGSPPGPSTGFDLDAIGIIHPATLDDCNTNGYPDACDIFSGSSQDTNLNGIPDECDPTPTPTTSPSPTPAATPSPSPDPSASPTMTASPTPSPTATVSTTPSPSPTPAPCGMELAAYKTLDTSISAIRADTSDLFTASGKFSLAASSTICEVSVFAHDARSANSITNLSCRLMIHASAGGVPGAVVADLGFHAPFNVADTGIDEMFVTAGNDIYRIDFRPPPFVLPAGTWWLSIYDQNPGNTILRVMRTTTGGGDSAQSGATPPTTWIGLTRRLAIAISGEPAPTPTPTMTATPTPATASPSPGATPIPPTPTATPGTATATPTAPVCCPGDANNSGSFVDANDFIAVQANFGADNGLGGPGDADCSGSFVDANDFIAVQAAFGADCN